MTRKTSKKKKQMPKVNPDLEGFDIKIDTFGEIKSNYDIEKINKFLDNNVEDKKLIKRNDVNTNEATKTSNDPSVKKKKSV